ncbi:PREDICTED: COMPASS-like H3K4 histone methylase component WDR5B [Acropora digitifera]|uniref:COMPASS-like H3K4 histone methylase component WDR5B n=1 Tax=Acropora digitifera TaxID=70779 RepID=UPI00077ADECB|nr:PREDICTED: COMPASS-like H3K4 histone methylase component WDR5B [Acropora digitifera]
MESLLVYSSDSDSDEPEQNQRLEESEKKRKVTKIEQGSDVSGEKDELQLVVKRTKSCLQSSDERNVRNNIPDSKQNSCVLHQASKHQPHNMSRNFDVSHSLAPPGRNVKNSVPSLTSTMRGSVSANSSKIKPYISKRERQKSIEPITSGVSSANASISSTEPQQRVTEFDFMSKQDEERTSNEAMSNKKPNYFNRPPKQVVVTFEGHSQGVNCVRWHPTRSNLLVSASMDHSVRVWDASSGTICRKLTHHTAAVKDAKWNLDGSQVLSFSFLRGGQRGGGAILIVANKNLAPIFIDSPSSFIEPYCFDHKVVA